MTHYSSITATEIRTGTMLLCFRVHKLWNIVRSLINNSGNWIVMRSKIHERMLPHNTVLCSRNEYKMWILPSTDAQY